MTETETSLKMREIVLRVGKVYYSEGIDAAKLACSNELLDKESPPEVSEVLEKLISMSDKMFSSSIDRSVNDYLLKMGINKSLRQQLKS